MCTVSTLATWSDQLVCDRDPTVHHVTPFRQEREDREQRIKLVFLIPVSKFVFSSIRVLYFLQLPSDQ